MFHHICSNPCTDIRNINLLIVKKMKHVLTLIKHEKTLYFNCYNELALGWVIACEQVNHLGM